MFIIIIIVVSLTEDFDGVDLLDWPPGMRPDHFADVLAGVLGRKLRDL